MIARAHGGVRTATHHEGRTGVDADSPTSTRRQKRIVAKVDHLMALCDDLEAKQTKKRDLATQSTYSAVTALASAERGAELSLAWRRVPPASNARLNARRCEKIFAALSLSGDKRPSDGSVRKGTARGRVDCQVGCRHVGDTSTLRCSRRTGSGLDCRPAAFGPKNGYRPRQWSIRPTSRHSRSVQQHRVASRHSTSSTSTKRSRRTPICAA